MQSETALDLLGAAEVAAVLGVSRKTVAAYLARGQMPAPDARLACGPIWRRGSLEVWLATREQRNERAELRLAELEKRHAKILDAIADRDAPPEDWRKREQLHRNWSNAKRKRRGRRPTVSVQLADHSLRELERTLEQHSDVPAVRKLAAELDEADRLRERIEARKTQAFERAVA
jgi:prophage regulatory protein